MISAMAGLILMLVAQPAAAQPYDAAAPHGGHRGASIRILRDYQLPAGATARGPVIVIGGSATIEGLVLDDVFVLGGPLRVGPRAVVEGDVVTVGRRAQIDPLARVRGRVAETAVGWPGAGAPWSSAPPWLAAVALAVTLLRVFLTFVVAVTITLVAPQWVRSMAARVGEAPAASAVVGLACEVCFVPALAMGVIALGVSLVGIPLIGVLPLVVAAAAILATAGFAAVAARVGARARGTTLEQSGALVADVSIGLVVIVGPSLVAHAALLGPWWMSPVTASAAAVGLLLEFAVWAVGIGAACTVAFRRWSGPARLAGVTPVPPATSAPAAV